MILQISSFHDQSRNRVFCLKYEKKNSSGGKKKSVVAVCIGSKVTPVMAKWQSELSDACTIEIPPTVLTLFIDVCQNKWTGIGMFLYSFIFYLFLSFFLVVPGWCNYATHSTRQVSIYGFDHQQSRFKVGEKSPVILAPLVGVWAPADTALSRTNPT